LDIFLGGMVTLLIWYLANILLILPYVVCVYSRYAVEMGLSSVLLVLVAGFMARLSADGCNHFVEKPV